MKAALKGVYKLNPTSAVMKSGQEDYRRTITSDVKGYKKVKPPKANKGNKK